MSHEHIKTSFTISSSLPTMSMVTHWPVNFILKCRKKCPLRKWKEMVNKVVDYIKQNIMDKEIRSRFLYWLSVNIKFPTLMHASKIRWVSHFNTRRYYWTWHQICGIVFLFVNFLLWLYNSRANISAIE